jgi:TonB-linked SusC/RagA family outer membrane protein
MKKNLQLQNTLLPIVRITLTQILILVVFAGFSWANKITAQEILSKRLTLTVEEQPVKVVLAQIEKAVDIRFLYSSNIIKTAFKVSLNVSNKPLSEILPILLTPLNVEYNVVDKQIILRRSKQKTEAYPNNPKTAVSEQQVSGKVTNENEEGMIGVTVSVKGTTQGTTTDANGKFTLNVPDANSILVFRFIGYKSKEITVGSQTNIAVSLAPDISALEEVVVVGYGQQSKVSLTNSVGTLKGGELVKRPVSNLQQGLQGQIAGLTVIDQGGSPGRTASTLRVRGITTLSNSNEALVIVDGIEQLLTNINPDDVESVSVLKDAASTAIYGSRAANGVIMITTKRAKEGKVSVSYSGFYATQRSVNNPVMDLEGYLQLQKVAFTNAKIALPPRFTDQGMQDYLAGNKSNPELFPDVNSWFQTLLKSAPQHNNSISISGGNESMRARLSIRQQKQASILAVPQDFGADLRDIRLNTDFKLSKKLHVSTDINYRSNYTLAPYSEFDVFNRFLHGSLFATPRYTDALEGQYPGITGTYGLSQQGVSPKVLAELDGTSKRFEESIFAGAKAEYQIIKGLSISSQLALRVENLRQKDFLNSYRNVDLVKNITRNIINNSLIEVSNTNSEYTWNNFLNYETNLGKHYLKALLGYSTINNQYRGLAAYRQNFYNNDIQSLSQGANDGTKDNNGSDAQFGLRSYFGRINYSYADKYLFEANGRYDGSSRFTGGNVYSFFPSFSAGWRLSEESFMKQVRFVDELKVRASWGQTGSQSVGLYSYYQSLAASSYGFNGTPVVSFSPAQLANKDITWETTTQVNLGLDAVLFRGFTLGLDYYKKRTEGILLNLPIPTTIGLAAPPQNAGIVENSGIEIQAGYRNAPSKNLRYSAVFNFSNNKNKVISLAGTGPFISGSDIDPLFIVKEGLSINSLWGYETDGFFKTAEEAKNYPTITANRSAGDVKYLDLNGDGKIDANDRTVIGSSFPDFIYSFNGNIGYKNFELSLFFQGAAGVDARLSGALAENGNNEGFVPAIVSKDYWTPENPNARFPRPLKRDLFNMYTSDRLVVNGDYLRLKNVQLLYNLPKSIIEKVKMTNASIYVSATNVLTFSKLNEWGLDPEAGSGRGIYYPQVSVMSLGANIQF